MHNHMDESNTHKIDQNKTVKNKYIWYDSIYTMFKNMQT